MSRRKLKEQVFITGVGCSRFGDLLSTPELKGTSIQELTARAVKEALDDAGISGQDVDAVFAGNAMVHSSQVPGTYSQLSKWTGTQFKTGVHCEAQCSTTNVGAAMAAMAIASGAYDTVLVYGFETTRTKVKDFSPYEREPISHQQTWLWTDMAVNQAYSVPQGYDIFSVYNGLVALGYCRKHCGSWEVEGITLSGDATLLYATHNIAPACHPRFEKIAPYVYGHLQLKEGPIVQAVILGVEPTPEALHDLFNRGPVPAKAETIEMEDLPILGFRVTL